MKREIKFRYVFQHNETGRFCIKEHSLDWIEEDFPLAGMERYNCVDRLQFTGLKDKNGKEVYESDILKMGNYIGEVKQLDGGMWYINHQDTILKYKYQIHCEVCDTNREAFFFDFLESWMIEVIGNIYENPNL